MEPVIFFFGSTFVVGATGVAFCAMQYALREQRHRHNQERIGNDCKILEFKKNLENRRFVLEHNSHIMKQIKSSSALKEILPLTGTVAGDLCIEINENRGGISYKIDNRPSIIVPALESTKKIDPVLVYSGKDYERIEIRNASSVSAEEAEDK